MSEEKQKACKKHVPDFNEKLAEGFDAYEVRKRWPRWSGTCECGFSGVSYASVAHYILGDY